MGPERSIDALRPGAAGDARPSEPGARPWLNTVEHVDAIVREFGSQTLRRFSQPDTDAFMRWVEGECLRLNALFLGYAPDAVEFGGWRRDPWNTPERLGRFVRIHYAPADEVDRFAVRDAFMFYANDIVVITRENAGRPVEDWGVDLDALTERIVRALLGLPDGSDPDVEGGDIDIYPPGMKRRSLV
jgi:hypothetical protein